MTHVINHLATAMDHSLYILCQEALYVQTRKHIQEKTTCLLYIGRFDREVGLRIWRSPPAVLYTTQNII